MARLFGTPSGNGLRILRKALLPAAISLFATCASAEGQALPGVQDQALPRAQDLAYGAVLYEYYQGNAFAALTHLEVAEARGGIEGHGDHPLLVEGGLMLAYGMTREAKALFEQVLQEKVAPATRNQAWFYLGKVFYLEQDPALAGDALARVDGALLEEHDRALHEEWLYLRGQLTLAGDEALLNEIIDRLPAASLWRSYLRYNQAVKRLAEDQPAQATDSLGRIAGDLGNAILSLEEDPEAAAELTETRALRERVMLSRAQLQLQQGDYAAARASLEEISLDSAFSDQALFHFAVAAAQEKDYGVALQALNTLQARPLFTPWLQQVPYARGFLFEELGEDQAALQAYKMAAGHYQNLTGELARARNELSEAVITKALGISGHDAALSPALSSPTRSSPTLGAAELPRDAYGRLRVQPADFSLAALLATEPFQIGLRDLHELYRLQELMSVRERQLDAFHVMLETRARQRAERIGQTREALQAQQADQWLARQAEYNARVNRATEQEDMAFFMTAEQKEFDRIIQRALAKLAVLPDDARTAEQRRKLRRIKAYFDWQVADQYAVNRWAVQKQLNGLNRAMEEFTGRQAGLAAEMGSDGRNRTLTERVADGQRRLRLLKEQLALALADARELLLGQVREELARQEREVQYYLRAARQAQARLADRIYQASAAAPVSGAEAGALQ